MTPVRARRRLGTAAGTVAVLWLLVGPTGPVAATLTQDEIGCQGSITITGRGDGESAGPIRVDVHDATVRVPRAGTYSWRGQTGIATTTHAGQIALRIARWDVPLARWQGTAEQRAASGTGRPIAEVFQVLPRGMYTLVGHHEDAGGRCEGRVVVLVGGSGYDVAIGAVVAAFTMLSAATFVLAARRAQPAVGAVAGALLGVFLAADLVMLAAIASDSSAVVLLPTLLLAAGTALGIRGRRARTTA